MILGPICTVLIAENDFLFPPFSKSRIQFQPAATESPMCERWGF